VVAGAGNAELNLVRAVGELEARWQARLGGVRADAAALRMIALLPAHPSGRHYLAVY
jgi:hypothetical protein